MIYGPFIIQFRRHIITRRMPAGGSFCPAEQELADRRIGQSVYSGYNVTRSQTREHHAMAEDLVKKALELFGLALPITQEQLDRKRKELLHTWDPHRFAHLSNNPRRYMQMVRKGEAMTKELEAAYDLLLRKVIGKRV
jgi:hypothetical protein